MPRRFDRPRTAPRNSQPTSADSTAAILNSPRCGRASQIPGRSNSIIRCISRTNLRGPNGAVQLKCADCHRATGVDQSGRLEYPALR